MADVFVSYAREDEPQANKVAEALRALGHRAWRDDELPAHRSYADVIEERLNSADAVIVLWSAEAKKSQWVRAEADSARNRGTLIQASLDRTIPPIPFNQIQCADLSGCGRPQDAPGWPKLVGSVRALLSPGTPAEAVTSPPRRQQVSVCVLPFANMSGDAEQEYFSDGISEDITTDLSKVSALAVTARNTAFEFKRKSVDVCDVAKKLGVSHVLEGSVRKVGNRVRITAQLVDGARGDHVWADRYDRDLTDIFAIQDEISKAIVEALKLKLLPEELKAIEQRGTTSAEAYKFYLMARQYWVTGNYGDRRREERVIRICQRAIEIDPAYARAWALLSIAQSSLRFWFGQPGDDGVAAAQKALSIDPAIAEAHCALARLFAEEQRFEDAAKEIATALELDPDSWEVNREAARICMAQRRIPAAKLHFEKAVAAMQSDFYGWGLQMSCNIALGDRDAARRAGEIALVQADKALVQDPGNASALAMSGAIFLILGQPDRAEERMERALLLDPHNLNVRYFCGCAYAMAGDVDAAIQMLGPLFDHASKAILAYTEVDPDLDDVRADPRFNEMLRRATERVRSTAEQTSPIAAA